MRNPILLATFLLLTACGGSDAKPNDPSQANKPTETSSAPATTATSPASTSTADPSTTPASPASSTTASSTSASSGGGCKEGAVPTGVKTLNDCLAGCDKLDDKVPEGAKCIPPRVSCKSQCNQQFKK